MAEQIGLNYDKIKADVQNIVDVEIVRIELTPILAPTGKIILDALQK